MQLDLPILPHQRRALAQRGDEVLLAAESRSGASHALRLAALRRIEADNQRVLLVCADEAAMRRDHLEGPSGFWELLRGWCAEMTDDGKPAVAFEAGNFIKFFNGSSIHLGTSPALVRRSVAELVLVDDADELPFQHFQKFLTKAPGPGDGTPRLIVVARRPHDGWVGAYWGMGEHPARPRVDLATFDLPENLRGPAVETKPHVSFGDYIARVCRDFRWYPHTELMVATAQRQADGELPRVICQAPPRSRKSLVWARLFPAYNLHIRPWDWTGVITAEEQLALMFSKDARTFYAEGGGLFRADAKDAALWRTPAGGGMLARTPKRGLFGHGINHAVVDDPFPNWPAAQSLRNQKEIESFFWDTLYNRLDPASVPRASITVNAHRLAEGDLNGRLYRREEMGKHPPEDWYVLDLPAFKMKKRAPLPVTVKAIDDGRADGQSLCPPIFGEDGLKKDPGIWTDDELHRLQASNSISFAAMYLQDPDPETGGGLFGRNWHPEIGTEALIAALAERSESLSVVLATLQVEGSIPTLHDEVRAWDWAANEAAAKRGDMTASVRGASTGPEEDALLVFTDAFELRVGAGLKELVLETARADGVHVRVCIPEEVAMGKVLSVDIQNALRAEGFTVVMRRPSGSKKVRATPHAGAAKPLSRPGGEVPGRCRLLAGERNSKGDPGWQELFRLRHFRFTGLDGGDPDDMVDAASDVVAELFVSALPKFQVFSSRDDGDDEDPDPEELGDRGLLEEWGLREVW